MPRPDFTEAVALHQPTRLRIRAKAIMQDGNAVCRSHRPYGPSTKTRSAMSPSSKRGKGSACAEHLMETRRVPARWYGARPCPPLCRGRRTSRRGHRAACCLDGSNRRNIALARGSCGASSTLQKTTATWMARKHSGHFLQPVGRHSTIVVGHSNNIGTCRGNTDIARASSPFVSVRRSRSTDTRKRRACATASSVL